LNALLKVMMADPDLFRFGYYQISTGSGRNYDTIKGTLELMPADKLNGFPFKLRLVQESTTYVDKDGKRKKTDKWFLQLEPDPTIVRELYRRQTARMIGAPEPQAAIPESIGPDWSDIVEVDAPAPPPYAEDKVEIGVEVTEPDEPEAEAPAAPKPDDGPKAKNGNGDRSWPSNVIKTIVPKYAENPAAAVGMLNHSTILTDKDEIDVIVQWCQHYRSARDVGDDPEKAAKYADEKLAAIAESA